MGRSLILFFVCFFAFGNIMAQRTSSFQIWHDITPTFQFSRHWRFGGDIGYRIEPSSGSQKAYIRPGISYLANKIINFTIGVANFNSWKKVEFTSAEFRTFGFIVVNWPKLGGFTFKHRLGVEQRRFYKPGDGLNEVVYRARYYLEFKSPNFTLFGLKAPFFLMTNFEILRDMGNDSFGRLADHNRYTLGVGNNVTKQFRAEVRFKLIDLIDPNINEFIREINIVRLRLYYRFAST
jgi:uncharacterized protein DUF2490